MKTLILPLIASIIFATNVFGQQNSTAKNKNFQSLQLLNQQDVPYKKNNHTVTYQQNEISNGLQVKQTATKNYSNTTENFQTETSGNIASLGGNSLSLCNDTSFGKQVMKSNSITYVSSTFQTADGGLLVCGNYYDTMQAHDNARIFGFVTKFDARGGVSWSKDIKDPNTFSTINLTRAAQLSNGNIILTGNIDYGDSSAACAVIALSNNGSLLWMKTFYSRLTTCNSGSVSIFINAICEGLNNDILLSGTTLSCTSEYETIISLDNLGNIKWDRNFSHASGLINGIGIFMEGNNILAIGKAGGLVDGTDDLVNIHFLTLDYNSGNIIGKKSFVPSYDVTEAFNKSYTHWYTYAVKQNNGHYLLIGKLYSDYDSTATDIYHFGVTEFDNDHDFVSGYSVKSQIHSSFYNDNITANANGKVVLTLGQNDATRNINFYVASIYKQQFIKRRKMTTDLDLKGTNSLAILNDGAYINMQSLYGFNGNIVKNYMNFKKFYDSYAANSACFGSDSAFATIDPLLYSKYDNVDFNLISLNNVYEIKNNFSTQNNMTVIFPGCSKISRCDSVKIHAPVSLCAAQPEAIITASKNAACGAAILWQLDTNAVKNLAFINDTTLGVSFNKNWEGYIYAKLQGSCGNSIIDSQLIKVTVQKAKLDLGPDTVLCKNSVIQLKAQQNFTSYAWQDGSTDSVLNVYKAGTYYVSAIDYCGNIQNDTIIVKDAPVFDLGLAKTISTCNNDSVTITAAEGFLNYTWEPAYNIANNNSNTITVFPIVDTDYILTAEKWAGCFVKDTIHINAFHAAAINLGNDTAFCKGGSITLNAGDGFSSYAWNTGATSSSINANTAGTYSVTAIDEHGCSSSASLTIKNIYEARSIYLGNDTSFCKGSSVILNAGDGFSSYTWNTGAKSSSINANAAGTYSVIAIDEHGCTSSASLTIKNIYQALSIYLGNDTSFCKGSSVILNAGNGFSSYAWNTGATSSSINANTAGTYSVTAIDEHGCSSSASLTIKNIYEARSIYLGNDTSFCKGSSVILNAGDGFSSYAWNTGATSSSINANAAGTYSVTAIDEHGCASYASFNIKNVFESPAIRLGNDTAFCRGGSLLLSAGEGYISYTWNTGATSKNITTNEPGTYTVTAIDANNCIATGSLRIFDVYNAPKPELGSDRAICSASNIILHAGSFASYTWQDGTTAPDFTATTAGTYFVTVKNEYNCVGSDTIHITNVSAAPTHFLPDTMSVCPERPAVLQPSTLFTTYAWSNNSTTSAITVTQPGTYWLRVTTKDGCTGTDTTVVYAKDCIKKVVFPSGFTPNHDGLNDVFRAKIFGTLDKFHLTIFNRFGQRVFETSDAQQGWDGTLKGYLQDQGSYVWVCQYKLSGENETAEKGTITLLK